MEELADISIFNSLEKTTYIHNDLSPWEPGGWSPEPNGTGDEWSQPGYAQSKENALNAGDMALLARKDMKAWNDPGSSVSAIRAQLALSMAKNAEKITQAVYDFISNPNPRNASMGCALIINKCQELQQLAYQASMLPKDAAMYNRTVNDLHAWVKQKNIARRKGRP